MKRKAYQIEHGIDFTARLGQEICSCPIEPFDISEGEALPVASGWQWRSWHWARR